MATHRKREISLTATVLKSRTYQQMAVLQQDQGLQADLMLKADCLA
jgi:hypothetical protein